MIDAAVSRTIHYSFFYKLEFGDGKSSAFFVDYWSYINSACVRASAHWSFVFWGGVSDCMCVYLSDIGVSVRSELKSSLHLDLCCSFGRFKIEDRGLRTERTGRAMGCTINFDVL